MINEYLTLISKASLAIWLGVLIATITIKYFFIRSTTQRSALEFQLLFLVIMGTLRQAIEYRVGQLFGIDELKHWVRVIWYFSFALTDFTFVIFTVLFIRWQKLKSTYCVNGIFCVVMTLGLLQVARYVDRFVLETDQLGYVVSNGVPAGNTIITMLVVSELVKTIIVSIASRKESKYA